MKKIIEHFKNLFGIRKEEIRPAVESKSTRKPKKTASATKKDEGQPLIEPNRKPTNRANRAAKSTIFAIDEKKKCKEIKNFDIDFDKHLILFAYAYVNPFGPTLYVHVAGRKINGARSELVQVAYHPTSISTQIVGEVTLEVGAESLKEVLLYGSFFPGELPTLFLKGQWDQSSDQSIPLGSTLNQQSFEGLVREFISHSIDANKTLQLIEKFEADPWGRLEYERDSAFSDFDVLNALKEQMDGGVSTSEEKTREDSLEEKEIEKLLRLLMKNQNFNAELRALRQAYGLAIEEVIPENLLILNQLEFMKIYVRVCWSCGVDIDQTM
ncbi:MAG TPA: hypothetical protein DCS15_04180 [Flavobacteriales bacterium]|nr:hypothetical protein [Flavobacteriales bacterium]